VTRGQLSQRAGSLGLNGGGAAAAVPPVIRDNHHTGYPIAGASTQYTIITMET